MVTTKRYAEIIELARKNIYTEINSTVFIDLQYHIMNKLRENVITYVTRQRCFAIFEKMTIGIEGPFVNYYLHDKKNPNLRKEYQKIRASSKTTTELILKMESSGHFGSTVIISNCVITARFPDTDKIMLVSFPYDIAEEPDIDFFENGKEIDNSCCLELTGYDVGRIKEDIIEFCKESKVKWNA